MASLEDAVMAHIEKIANGQGYFRKQALLKNKRATGRKAGINGNWPNCSITTALSRLRGKGLIETTGIRGVWRIKRYGDMVARLDEILRRVKKIEKEKTK